MIILPVIFDKIKPLKDKSLQLTFETQEINAEDMTTLFNLYNSLVYLGVKKTEINPDMLNIKDLPKEFKNDKSPSQRLRAVLYIYWEKNKPDKDFETFYKKKMEEFINLVKDKIN